VASFLTLDEVLAIHAHQIDTYGGMSGLRERPLLESALAMPQASFAGQELHATRHEQAAAYLFHLAQNHPFVDGNKRTGLATCLVFLGLNEIRLAASEDEVVDLVLRVASGSASKSDVAVFLARHAKPRQ